jgi:DNA-binding CsgD family transcriptional regulator
LSGIVTHDVSSQSLAQSLRLIQAGERIFPRSCLEALTDDDRVNAIEDVQTGALSPREAEIMRHLVRGSSNKSIARELGIAETTVKVHIKGVLRKIGVPNRTMAALWAERSGFEERMAQAERNVKQAEEEVSQQQTLIAELEAAGDPAPIELRREALRTLQTNLETARARLQLQRNIPRVRR